MFEDSYLNWDSNVETKFSIFDSQHKEIIYKINNLYKILMEENNEIIFKNKLKEIIEFLKFHYTSEEIMYDLFVLDNNEHISQHIEIIEYLTSQFNKTKITFKDSLRICSFLRNAIYEHVGIYDKHVLSKINEKINDD